MTITVRYMAQARRAAGRAAEQVDVKEPCTVQELLARLAARGEGPLGRLLLDERGVPQPSLLLFLGDRQVAVPAAPLRDGDVVTVLTPMAGG